jgi:phosphoribosyl 1,2-cyclic phosphodiesterase
MSKVCQLFSGSSGNSIYIENSGVKILVDAGVTAKRMEEALNNIGVSPSEINALFITHEHIDHIKGVRVFSSRYGIPVFAPEKSMDKMLSDGVVNDKVNIHKCEDMEFSGIDVKPFELSHDSVQCCGYKFTLKDGRKVSVCTDTGVVSDTVKNVLQGSDLIFLESNHEVTMLQNGPYPYMLKQRILSSHGHLSNDACASLAVDLAKGGTTRFVLSHLSAENNHPDIARQTTLASLNEVGFEENKDFRLKVASKINNERPIVL